MTSFRSAPRKGHKLVAAFACLLAFSATLPSAFARGASTVAYSPVLKSLEGLIPFNAPYTLAITSPDNFPTGTTSTVTFRVVINTKPANVTTATALSYLQFSSPSLSFSNKLETKSVTVTLAVPAGAVPGSYGYQIYTSGWPSTISFSDFGAAVNMTVSLAPTLDPPTVTINQPADGSTYTYPFGTLFPVTIALNFTGAATSAYPITSVNADLDGSLLVPQNVIGLGTASVTSTNTSLVIPAPGSYLVTARATNANGTAVDKNQFFVKLSGVPGPTVVINTPSPGATFSYPSPTDLNVSVPFTFTGTSNYGGIRMLTAKLDGVPISFTTSGLNTLVATGSTTLPFSNFGGTHTIDVTAIDDYGIASASTYFIIVGPTATEKTVTGTVFFDANENKAFDPSSEIGISGVPLTLRYSPSGQVVATTTSLSDGSYSFKFTPQSPSATYKLEVVATTPSGLTATVAAGPFTLSASSPATTGNLNFGYTLDFPAIKTMTANGFTIGYWKNNVQKAIDETTGWQVDPATTLYYTRSVIPTIALSPFSSDPTAPYSPLTPDRAVAIMGNSSSAPVDLLAKQLLAAEYNYVNGGNLTLSGTQLPLVTYLFMYWGEYRVLYPSQFTSADLNKAANWFNAYNNTHGGVVGNP